MWTTKGWEGMYLELAKTSSHYQQWFLSCVQNRVGMKRFTEMVNLQWSRKILLVSVRLFFLDPFTYDLSLSALSHQSDGYYNV